MSIQDNTGVLTPRELGIVASVVARICGEQENHVGNADSEHIAARAFALFQFNRDLDEAGLEAMLRAEGL